MPASDAYVRGHSRVGELIGGSPTWWGKCREEAVSVNLNVQTVELHPSDGKSAVDVGITRADCDIVVGGIDGSLTNIHRFLGLSAGDLTGGLPATSEVLSINAENLGETVRNFLSEGVGALGTVRRINAPRAKPFGLGSLQQTKTGWMTPEVTLRALDPGTDIVVIITDIVES